MSARKISQPEVTLNIIPSQTLVSNTAQRVLMVGQQTTGTAVSGELQSEIQNDGSWDTLFGEDSMLAAMVREFRDLNQDVRLDAIGLDDDGSAVDASGDVDFTGTATATGTITVDIGSSVNHSFELAIAVGDTASDVGDALVAAITADTKAPVTGVNTTGSVALTAVNGGTEGNSIGLKVTGSAAGISTTVTAMSSGATDPDVTSVFDVVGDERYQTVVWPFGYTLTELTGFLDPRFNVNNDVLDGVGITLSMDTFANLDVAGNAENSESLVILGNQLLNKTLNKGGAILELNTVIASEFAALRSLRLEEGTNIADLVITNGGGNDTFGGAHIASLPYFNTPFDNLPTLDIGDGFTAQEVENLQDDGISVLGNNQSGNIVVAGEIVTTYKTDNAGNPDTSFKFLNSVDTITNIREFQVNNLKAAYAQFRLTSGSPQGGSNITSAENIRSFVVSLYLTLASDDFLLTQNSTEALRFYKNNLIVTSDLTTGTVTINQKTPIVTQLRAIQGTIQIVFSATS